MIAASDPSRGTTDMLLIRPIFLLTTATRSFVGCTALAALEILMAAKGRMHPGD